MKTYGKFQSSIFLFGVRATILIVVLVVFGGVEQTKAESIADSVAEYSDTQGENSWYYGYYDGDSSFPYTNNPIGDDFELMTQFDDWGTGYRWMVQEGEGGYWTAIGEYILHPNDEFTSGGRQQVEHWAVRRWVSEVDGTINITGNLADAHSGAGDGIVGHIFIDGTDVFTQVIGDGDLTGVDYIVNAMVGVGSIVDFAVAPGSSDLTDSTRFTVVVTPEPSTLLLLGLGGLTLLRKRRT